MWASSSTAARSPSSLSPESGVCSSAVKGKAAPAVHLCVQLRWEAERVVWKGFQFGFKISSFSVVPTSPVPGAACFPSWPLVLLVYQDFRGNLCPQGFQQFSKLWDPILLMNPLFHVTQSGSVVLAEHWHTYTYEACCPLSNFVLAVPSGCFSLRQHHDWQPHFLQVFTLPTFFSSFLFLSKYYTFFNLLRSCVFFCVCVFF